MGMQLARLFGRSPFAPLQTHMVKVANCVHEILPLFEAVSKQDFALVEKICEKISKLEHDADLTKNDIRNNLPSGIFLPIAKASLLEILALQDDIADKAEDTAVLLGFRHLIMVPSLEADFNAFLRKNLETFEAVFKVIKEMDQLLETSFGGSEAEKVKKMVDDVAYKEHEVDLLQRQLMKKIFSEGEKMTSPDFLLWTKVVAELACISNDSEKLANRVRMILEAK